MSSERQVRKLSDIALVNPKESIPHGEVAKKVPMEKLRPFSRDVNEFVLEKFSGGAKFKNGDTIMARITPCLENGKTAKINFLDNDEVGFGSTEYIVFRAVEGQCDEDYLYYLITSPIVRESAIKSMVGSSGRQRVQTDVIQNLEILVPSFGDQQTIGRILRSIDDKIAVNDKINQNLIQQVESLWRNLEGKREWPLVAVGDFAKKIAMGPFGSNIKVSTFVPYGVPIISGNHLRNYFLDELEFKYITEEHAEKLKNSNVFPKDIVFTHAGNIGQVAMIPEGSKFQRYVLSQRQFYLRCDQEKAVPEYILMFFHSTEGQHELLSYANQTGVPSIAQPATNLKKILVPLPPIMEQQQWYECVRPLLELYLNNRAESECLALTRDTLLPKLMSGELDVSHLII